MTTYNSSEREERHSYSHYLVTLAARYAGLAFISIIASLVLAIQDKMTYAILLYLLSIVACFIAGRNLKEAIQLHKEFEDE